MTHQNEKSAWFPISLLKRYNAQPVILMALTFFNWRKLTASNPLGKLAAPRCENSQSLENIQNTLLGSTSPTTRYSQEQKGKCGHPHLQQRGLRRPQVSCHNSPS